MFFQKPKVIKIEKYNAFNRVLAAIYNEPLSSYMRLLIGLNKDGTMKNLSFSFLKDQPELPEESFFSLGFIKSSNQVDITFNSVDFYYSLTTEIPEKTIAELHKTVFSLYQKVASRENHLDPKKLLESLQRCVDIHKKVQRVFGGYLNVICSDIPSFIEGINAEFKQELNHLEAEAQSPSVASP